MQREGPRGVGTVLLLTQTMHSIDLGRFNIYIVHATWQ